MQILIKYQNIYENNFRNYGLWGRNSFVSECDHYFSLNISAKSYIYAFINGSEDRKSRKSSQSQSKGKNELNFFLFDMWLQSLVLFYIHLLTIASSILSERYGRENVFFFVRCQFEDATF